ncbi:MAG: phosphonate C-P lyase system protein PhnH [Turicibacter sp.]|nr:phosphonate C-P lyase system protein PhnH [Turicibacter sp.]
MPFDKVHDTQQIYRKVLHAMSRPGEISNIFSEVEGLTLQSAMLKPTVGFLYLLLDREVGFHVVSRHADEVSQLIAQLTYSKETPIEEADYIFVLQDALGELPAVFGKGKTGNLIDPQKSATLIVECPAVANNQVLSLKGPGIKSENFLDLGLSPEWLKARALANSEYPLGIDMMFVDGMGAVACLPRTSQIKEGA